MKECPNCHELVGDDVKNCFNCFYNFTLHKVLTPDERVADRVKEQENLTRKIEYDKELEKIKEEQIKNNPLYEYKVEVVNDNYDGTVDESGIQNRLIEYSSNGWRLHSIFSNEVGKNVAGISVGGIGGGVNSTVDQTILVFERCIKA